tara:strand:+ start:472 stop:585 length:114 start_codon:yes stop_codon:yes gene_type:complete
MMPTFSLRKIDENIVIKNGAVKKRAVVTAKDKYARPI